MGDVLLARDWRYICDSIYRINVTESVEELEKEALECLVSILHCTQGTFFVVKEGTKGSSLQFERPVDVGMRARYFDAFLGGGYGNDPYFAGAGAINKTETFRDSDLMPEEYRVQTRIYQDIYAKQGIHYGLRSYLVHNGTIIGNISMFNTKERGDFSHKDVTVLDTLAPHIALKLHDLLERERSEKGFDSVQADMGRRFGLTAREMEVTSCVLAGLSDAQIASRLNVSLSTVKKHLHNIYRKAGVGSRAQLAALVR